MRGRRLSDVSEHDYDFLYDAGSREQRMPDFVVVAYPGIVRNAENALETLGGLHTISSVSSSL
ncbi:unnamed protein product [Gongylonema pulchrum]|uniref:Tau95_N domain-containing protein n=1 Tax=Gongylonema pulchrum TaxID=637853 RepID=A0A183DZ62_9BILA|nr:unnamed protein product [Gongylonema pulchrum]